MHGQTFTLQGKVVDEQQQPIELVTVSVAKQGKMTMTSPRGEFLFNLTYCRLCACEILDGRI